MTPDPADVEAVAAAISDELDKRDVLVIRGLDDVATAAIAALVERGWSKQERKE